MATQTEKIEIKIDGKEYKEYNFLNITLVQELLQPNELRFTMQKKLYVVTQETCAFVTPKEFLGAKVSCQIQTARFDESAEQQNEMLEFKGIINNVHIYRKEMDAEQLIDVIAYSPDFLLKDHPHCYSYEDMSLKDIVAKTLEPYSIPNEIDPQTIDSIPYTVQYNETNYQFLVRLAQRYGEWMYHNGEKWIFGKVKKKNTLELYARTDVLNYRYEAGLFHHAVAHTHVNYLIPEILDKNNKDFPDLTSSGFHSLTDTCKEKSGSLFTKKTIQNLHGAHPEISETDELEVSLKAQLFGEKAMQTVCDGTSVRADLTLGSCIKIQDIYHDGENQAFDKKEELLVCRLVHTADANGNYRNEFTAISANSEYPPYYNSNAYPVAPAQPAIVTDNKDPEKMGRIRVQFPWQYRQDENLMTPWIRVAQPHGGPRYGFYFTPEINAEVMVDFENGNAEKPCVVGSMYNGEQRPDGKWYMDDNAIKAIRTRNGHTIEIRDDGDDGFIKIYDNRKENYILTFSTDEKLIKLESTGNIELYADKNIIMAAGENITINAGNNMDTSVGNNATLYVSSNQTVEIGANKEESIAEKYQLTAEKIREEATGKLEIYGNEIEQRAGSTLKFDGGKTLDLYAKTIRMN